MSEEEIKYIERKEPVHSAKNKIFFNKLENDLIKTFNIVEIRSKITAENIHLV